MTHGAPCYQVILFLSRSSVIAGVLTKIIHLITGALSRREFLAGDCGTPRSGVSAVSYSPGNNGGEKKSFY